MSGWEAVTLWKGSNTLEFLEILFSPSYFQYPLFRDYKNIVRGTRTYDCSASKCTEGRQNRLFFAKKKARVLFLKSTTIHKPDSRMEVSTEDVVGRRPDKRWRRTVQGSQGMVLKTERRNRKLPACLKTRFTVL